MSKRPHILILSGGKNTRLFPFEPGNKGYLSLMGKALVVRTVLSLQNAGFSDITIVVPKNDPDGEKMLVLLREGGVSILPQVVCQKESLGQGDAILQAREHITDDCLVFSPYYINAEEQAQKLLAQAQKHITDVVLLGQPTDNPSLYGIIEHSGDKVSSIIEKPSIDQTSSNTRVLSAYYLSKSFIETLAKTKPSMYSLEDAIQVTCKQNTVFWTEDSNPPPSLKYPWHLFKVGQYIFKHNTVETTISPKAKIAPTAVLDDSAGPIVIEDGAVIGHCTKISGPCYLGVESVVGDFSLVRESIIEAHVGIGAFTEVARCIFFRGSTAHYSYLADSIIGEGAKIGAGFVTANKRFDRADVRTKIGEKMVDSHMRGLGCIIGHHASIGTNVTTNPGVIIDNNLRILPNEYVKQSQTNEQKETAA